MVSLCIIARDESHLLADCLRSARAVAQEIIVVDTGSSDETPHLASALGAAVYHHPFADDFSAARNISLTHATGDWILIVDADELIDSRSLAAIRALVSTDDAADGYYIWRHNYFGDGTFNTFELLRLFRNKPHIRFERLVHESVKRSIDRFGGSTRVSDVIFHHFPFRRRTQAPAKSQLYRRLIEEQMKLTPSDGLYRVFLAIELAAMGSRDEAECVCQEALGRHAELAPVIHLTLAQIYRSCRDFERAIASIYQSLDAHVLHKQLIPVEFAHNLLGMAYCGLGHMDRAVQAFQTAIAANPALPQFHLNLGLMYDWQGSDTLAGTFYAKAVELNPFLSTNHILWPSVFGGSDAFQVQLLPEAASALTRHLRLRGRQQLSNGRPDGLPGSEGSC